jgi:hypothetical protein
MMDRREFLSTAGGLAVGRYVADTAHRPPDRVPPFQGAQLLVPMDDAQTNHLKAYGLAYAAIARAGRSEWLLNYRGGSFLVPDDPPTRRTAALGGVLVESVSSAGLLGIRATIEQNNMDAVVLERTPRMAIYSPPNAAPWDDAVTMALQYAEIPFTKVWDPEVIAGGLRDFDWLHLHHEDFTGQYSKFYVNYSGQAWLVDMVQRNQAAMRQLGFTTVPDLKKAVALRIRQFADNGGFLFAMCTATETLELALASQDVDIAAAFADGTPMAADATQRLDWSAALACQNARLEMSPSVASFSSIDGHQVNNPGRRQPLGAFQLFGFSAKIDPVPTMLNQCHRAVVPDFYGLTTSFMRDTLKPSVTILAEESGAPWVKYIHGDVGRGTWTYFGGHDPEDPQHQIGDSPTDLSLHTSSPGYRLILNNVLFPAARKRELKT